MQQLIDSGAAVNAKDVADFTPLHKAAAQGHNDTVAALLAAHAEANATAQVCCEQPAAALAAY